MVTNRLPRLLPTALDQERRDLYDAILGGPRAGQVDSVPLVDDEGRLEGPFNAFLVAPAVGHPLQAVGAALRYRTELPDRFREVAILVVAARCTSGFEQLVHEPIAAGLGITAQQLAGLRAGDHAPLPVGEALVADAAAEMMDDGDLSASTYERVRDLVGEAQLVELTTVVGYYRLLAMQMTVFRVSPPVSGDQRSTAPNQDPEA